MSKLRTITLAGAEYPLGQFTLGHVSRLAPLLAKAVTLNSVEEANATVTAVHIGLQSGGYVGKYEDVMNLTGVTVSELVAAKLEIGRAIGYYKDAEAETPGEA